MSTFSVGQQAEFDGGQGEGLVADGDLGGLVGDGGGDGDGSRVHAGQCGPAG